MKFAPLVSCLVALMIPFFITIASVRLLLTPAFLRIEYRTPHFPPDPYGFTLEDRIRWAQPTVRYLTDSKLSLETLKFSNGKPVYNQRELAHMLDVKNIIQSLLKLWYIIILLLLSLAALSWKSKMIQYFLRGIYYGSWLSIVLVLVLGLIALAGFELFFTYFHERAFTGDSWLFYDSDTLIRLFPFTFWQDYLLYMGFLSLLCASFLLLLQKGLQRHTT